MEAAYRDGRDWTPRLNARANVETVSLWVACVDEEIAGVVGAIQYETLCYVGSMGVDPRLERRGIASALLAHLLATQEEQGVRTFALDVTPDGEPLYRRFGFETVDTVSVLAGTPRPSETPGTAVAFASSDFEELIACDRAAYGVDRRPMLQSVLAARAEGTLVVRTPGGRIAGYLVDGPAILGPFVAAELKVAGALLDAAARRITAAPSKAFVPARNADGTRLLMARGFARERVLAHMRRGAPLADRRERIVGQVSLGTG